MSPNSDTINTKTGQHQSFRPVRCSDFLHGHMLCIWTQQCPYVLMVDDLTCTYCWFLWRFRFNFNIERCDFMPFCCGMCTAQYFSRAMLLCKCPQPNHCVMVWLETHCDSLYLWEHSLSFCWHDWACNCLTVKLIEPAFFWVKDNDKSPPVHKSCDFQFHHLILVLGWNLRLTNEQHIHSIALCPNNFFSLPQKPLSSR